MKTYMDRAIELAVLGGIDVKSNPLVGAVIVKDGVILGEGYHRAFGQHHAEVEAMLQAKDDIKGSTIYVTLEPCSHQGKTPSCAQAIIDKGIKKVVIASIDPNPLVSGRGIEMLKKAGIEVEVGLNQTQSDLMNTMFYHYITKRKPYVAIKMALTLDGKFATHTKDSKWITSSQMREDVHEERGKFQSILVGVQTIIEDNPALNVRKGEQIILKPLRIILDTQGRIPLDSRVLNDSGNTLIVTCHMSSETRAKVLKPGVEVLYVKEKNHKVDLNELLEILYEKHIKSILVEGGKHVFESFLNEGLVNYVYAYIAPKIVGGNQTLTLPMIDFMKDALSIKNPEITIIDHQIKIEGAL
jgi:diaminohydroxyphosphoribosylaminopyrimidine deaminase/5-amino-6-(5-phosphoribosylamino)uracil reductase